MELERLIEEICSIYLERLLAARGRVRGAGEGGSAASGVAAFVRQEERRMAVGDRSLVEADARKLLAEAGYELPDAEFDELCCALQRTFLQGCWMAHA